MAGDLGQSVARPEYRGGTGVPATDERRERLLAWLRSHRTVTGIPTRAITFHCPAYISLMHGVADTAHRDLTALAKQGLVERSGRPARWRAA